MRKILGFLVDSTRKPETDSLDPRATKPQTALKQASILKKERDFVLHFMFWCAHSVFKCDYADWFLDYKLKPTIWNTADISHISYTVRTVRQNRRLEYSELEMDTLHARLIHNDLVMIVCLSRDNIWHSNRFNLIALCVAVAEVTEEISFVFNAKVDTALKIFAQAVFYGWKDKGFLYALCAFD